MKKQTAKPKNPPRHMTLPRGTVKSAAWSIRLAKTRMVNKHTPAGSDGSCSDD